MSATKWFRRLFSRASSNPIRRAQKNRPPRPLIERLEDRLAPAATLYLDFGDNFTGANGLTTDGVNNVTQLDFENMVDGPDFGGVGDAEVLTFTSFAAEATAFGLTAAQTTTMRNSMIALIQRYYDPFDVNIVVAAAATLQDVQNTLASTGTNDAYTFIAGIVPSGGPISGGLNGQAGGDECCDGMFLNATDDTAVTLANNLFNNGSATLARGDTAFAYVTAHEAAHTFGMEHTDNGGGTDNTRLTTSDVISQFYDSAGNLNAAADQRDNFNFFSRFPLVRAHNAGSYTPYDRMVANVGVAAGQPAYITGTGAFDVITVTRTDATMAQVSVAAHRDNSYANQIGATFTYNVNYTNGLFIEAGFAEDRITIDATLAVPITLRGMASTDSLIVNGNGSTAVTLTQNPTAPTGLDGAASFGGMITAGGTTITFSEFEVASALSFTNIASLTVNGSAGTDSFTVTDVSVSTVSITGTINGLTMIPVTINDNDLLQVNGLGGTDTFSVTNLTMTATLGLNGGTGTNSATVSNTNISGAIGDGLSANNFSTFTVSNSTFSNNGGDGIQGATVGTVSFTNVTASGNDPGIDLNGFVSFMDVGGTYNGNLFQGVNLLNGGPVTLNGTTANLNGTDNIFMDTVTTVSLTNVTADSSVAADGVQIDNATSVGISGGSFSNNGTAPGHNGIELNFIATTVTLSGVTATGNGGNGFDTDDGGDIEVNGVSTFSDNGEEGIDLDNVGNVTILDTTANNNGGDGVDINGALDVTMNDTGGDLRFDLNGGNGVQLANVGNVDLTSGTAESNGIDGINILNALDVSIDFWCFNFNIDDGIELDTVADVVVDQTFANNNSSDGLVVSTAGDVTILDSGLGSQFNSNTFSGILLSGVGDVSITDTSASTNGEWGAFITPALSVTVIGSTFDDNGFAGLDTRNITGNVSVTDTSASGNLAFDGHFADTIGGDVVLANVTYSNNTNAGGAFGGRFLNITGVVDVTNSTMSGNSTHGLQVLNAAGVIIDPSTFSNNGSDGINLLNAGAMNLDDITADNNGNDGVEVGAGTAGTIENLTASTNGATGLHITGAGAAATVTASTFTNNPTGIEVNSGGTVTFGLNTTITGGTLGLHVDGITSRIGGLSLANTLFDSQSVFFVSLTNQAHIGPEFINALAARWNGGGIAGPKTATAMSAAELLALETRLRHYPDDATVGLIIPRVNYAVLDPSSGNMLAIGSFGNDIITVNTTTPGSIAVTMGGKHVAGSPFNMSVAPFNTGRIIIFALDGSDVVQTMGSRSAEVHGGNGNDYLYGGNVADVLYGDANDDYLSGGGGNDVLIGGLGKDNLLGGTGKDVLIGGTLAPTFTFNDVTAARDQWVATGNENAALITAMLAAVTDPNDAANRDILTGGTDVDLFIYRNGGMLPGSDTTIDFNMAQGDRRRFVV